jgi:hypothetical protein
MDATGTPGNVNLLWDVRLHQTSSLPSGGQTTLPSPFMDSSSAPALSAASAATSTGLGMPYMDLTSLPSDMSKLSLGPPSRGPLLCSWSPLWSYGRTRTAQRWMTSPASRAHSTHSSSRTWWELEEYCHCNDPKKCVCFQSFSSVCLRIVTPEFAQCAASLPFHLTCYVTSNTSVNWVKSMTPVELHLELMYVESLFEKAHTGAWASFSANVSSVAQV